MTRDEAAEKLYPPELVVSGFAYDDDWYRERTKEKAAFCAGWNARDVEVASQLNLFEESIRHSFKQREDKLEAEVARLREFVDWLDRWNTHISNAEKET
jgi:hypothetical protein